MPKFHYRKIALSRISFTACLVVIPVTQTNEVLNLLPCKQAHPKQKQLNNSQFTAKEEPERYSSQSDCEINTTEQTFSSFCIQIKGQDLNGNEGTWEKARLLAMRIMILTAKLVSDSDISLLRWIAGCQVFS